MQRIEVRLTDRPLTSGPTGRRAIAGGPGTRRSARRQRRGCDSLIRTNGSLIRQKFSLLGFAGICAQPLENAAGFDALGRQEGKRIGDFPDQYPVRRETWGQPARPMGLGVLPLLKTRSPMRWRDHAVAGRRRVGHHRTGAAVLGAEPEALQRIVAEQQDGCGMRAVGDRQRPARCVAGILLGGRRLWLSKVSNARLRDGPWLPAPTTLNRSAALRSSNST
jgi:hypothetical protein